MKCVQFLGLPMRVSDDDATRLVEIEQRASYCPKNQWKAFHSAGNTTRQWSYVGHDGKVGTLQLQR